MKRIDVIIPLYKPGNELFDLLDALSKQTVSIGKIILMNTEKKYLDQTISEEALLGKYKNVEIHHLAKEDFDHGATRHAGVQFSESDIFVLFTQDAIPADEMVIEHLIQNLKGQVAVSYGRQLPAEGCSETEKISRAFNYPENGRIKTKEDLDSLGIKTFFCSNVCAAYRRDIYEELGGFIRHTIFNEDMIFAAGVIKAGYAVCYEAQAEVIHSHNYTNMQQLHRNFDLGVSQADHPEVFRGIPSEKEGKRLVQMTCKALMKKHMAFKIPGFVVQCGFKYIGYLMGKNYQRLPKRLILKTTMNKAYWK